MMGNLLAAFDDPVRASQVTFRAILAAMARPGRIHAVGGLRTPPCPLARSTAALLLTLADSETTLWLDEQALAARDWVSFHCGSSLTPAAEARFAIALHSPSFNQFCAGTDEEPETSATLVLQVDSLGCGQEFRLEGPGLETSSILRVSGLEDSFVAEWQVNQRLFPRGIDVVLCAGDHLAALPRTVKLVRA